MRLIDADALETVLDGIAKYYIADKSFQCNFAAGVVCDIRDNVIAEMPTIEAEPVKHGRWIALGQYNPMRMVKNYKCSECTEWEHDCLNFCPNCGAKMDLEG